jgi:hypothetical protein
MEKLWRNSLPGMTCMHPFSTSASSTASHTLTTSPSTPQYLQGWIKTWINDQLTDRLTECLKESSCRSLKIWVRWWISKLLVWLLLYAHRHRSILGAAGHIIYGILTPANQLMVMGLKIPYVQSGFEPATFRSLAHELNNRSNRAHSQLWIKWANEWMNEWILSNQLFVNFIKTRPLI